MKRGIIIIALIILAILLLIFIYRSARLSGNVVLSVEDVSNSNYIINIENFRYSPQNLEINVGETVTWINKDNAKHTVTSEDEGPLNSILLPKEETYSYTFNELGEFDYYCVPHPYMKGTVVVN